MHRYGYALTLMLGLAFTSFAQAQTSFQTNDPTPTPTHTNMDVEVAVSSSSDNWSLFADETANVYHIDFQSLNVNINEVVVVNEDGKVLWKDNVFDLPVNTIYELDMSHYRPGTYTVELRTFTKVLRKEVDLVK